MPSTSLTIDQVLALLAGAPSRITALTADLSSAQLHSAPGHDEWSANDVLAHLRSCASVWGMCISVIIAEDAPTIRAVSPRTWIRGTNYLEQEFRPSLHAFVTQRTELLAQLEKLPPEGWSRAATVTGAGAPFVHTVHSYAQRLAIHERSHIKQIERIVNAINRHRT